MKKLLGFVLAIALTVSGISVAPASAQAAESTQTGRVEKSFYARKTSLPTTTLRTGSESAVAGNVYSTDFLVTNIKQGTYFWIYTSVEASGTLSISPQGSSSDPIQEQFKTTQLSDGSNVYLTYYPLYDITYTFSISFDQATNYEIYIDQGGASISKGEIRVTKGYTSKLTVSDAKGTIKWYSSKKSVATVSSKGVVTGKKKGTCVIYAEGTDTDGMPFALACDVYVRNNELTGAKMTVSDVVYGSAKTNVYSVKFDSKGNLVIKTQIVNNSGHTYTSLKNIKITIKDSKGKVVGKYKKSSMKKTLSSGSMKNLTFKIKKKNLKKKKADIAGGTASFSATGYYTVYY